MTHKFSFAILSAVSSSPQAEEDKGSLEDQITFARAAGLAQGGIETAGPFVLDGYSRSGYVNLSDALKEIPPLKDAIDALEKNKYDVLMLDNLERMGDLAPMLFTLFAKHKKQIHSARQSGRIYDPETYNPSADESAQVMMHVEGLIQGYRKNKLLRGLQVGLKKRVEMGKYSNNFPTGYIRINDNDQLDIDPPVANLYIQLKDKFLEGLPLRALAEIANASGVPSPEGVGPWHYMTIRHILANPFYSGKVFKNRYKVIGKKISKNGKPYPIIRRNPEARYYDGNHPALWTWDEHLRICAELEERYTKQPRHHPRTFSGLLYCSVCGSALTFKHNKYRCRKHPDHIAIPEREAEYNIGNLFAQAVRELTDSPPAPPAPDLTERVIADIEKQIAKVHRGYEAEIYDEAQAKARIDELNMQKAKVEASKDDRVHRLAGRARVMKLREEQGEEGLNKMGDRFVTEPKEKNNRLLRDYLLKIEITPEKKCSFYFR